MDYILKYQSSYCSLNQLPQKPLFWALTHFHHHWDRHYHHHYLHHPHHHHRDASHLHLRHHHHHHHRHLHRHRHRHHPHFRHHHHHHHRHHRRHRHRHRHHLALFWTLCLFFSAQLLQEVDRSAFQLHFQVPITRKKRTQHQPQHHLCETLNWHSHTK